MRVYNKGQRNFLVPIKSVKLPEGYQPKPEQKTFPIGPEETIEVEDKVAADLIKRYPRELREWGK